MLNPFARWGPAFAALSLAPQSVSAATVGDPAHPAELPAVVRSAIDGGEREVTINPGTYLVPGWGRSLFDWKDLRDVTLHGGGVTIIADGVPEGSALFRMERCQRVTIDGLTLSQSAMTFYQGRVVTADGDHCDWRPDAGYPQPDPKMTKMPGGPNVIDPATGRFKPRVGDLWDAAMRPLDNGDYRFTFPKTKPAVGDVLVGRFGDPNGNAPFKVHWVDCRNCTVSHVTMTRNGFSPIREEGGGGNHVLDCIWEPGPKPAGATTEPLIHSAADGFHSTGADPGPDVERCVMRGAMLDDCIAIHGSFAEVTVVDGRTITLKKGRGGLTVGSTARFCGTNGGVPVDATVAAVRQGPNQIVLTGDEPVHVGDKVYNPRACGAGFKVIDCVLGNTRSRGILVKADDGVVRGNTIDGCVMSAVSAGPEYYWNEAGYVRNLLIEKNDLRGCGTVPWGDAAVLIHGEGALGNQGVVVNDNRFFDCRNFAIRVEWAADTSIDRNQFVGPGQGAINVSHVRRVRVTANRAGGYKSPLVTTGDDVQDVTQTP